MSSKPLRFFLGLPFRLFRLLTNGGFWVAVIGMAGLNFATLTVDPLNADVSSRIEKIAGVTTVRGTRDIEIATARKAQEAQFIDDLAELEKTRSALVDENNWLSGELMKSTDRMASMTADFEAQKLTVIDGMDVLTARVEQGVLRVRATIAAQGIPYLGVFAVRSNAAQQVRDACLTIAGLAAVGAHPTLPNLCADTVPSREAIVSSVRKNPEGVWKQAQRELPDLPNFQLLLDSDLRRQFGPRLD